MIVNVYYRDEETGSVRAGRPYSYRCSIPNASVGMEVIAPTAKREARAVICEINVPDVYKRQILFASLGLRPL